MKILSILLNLVILFSFSNAAIAETIKDLGNRPKIHKLLDIKLNSFLQRAYNNGFRHKTGITAFAFDVNGADPKAGVVLSGFHNLASAKRVAILGCNNDVEKELRSKADCQVYAIILPAKMSPNDTNSMVLGNFSRFHYTNEYLKRHEVGTYSAFAMANNNAYGFSNGQKTREQAIKLAILFCEARHGKIPDTKSWLILPKQEQCRALDVRGPE